MSLSVLVIENDLTIARLFAEVFSRQGWYAHLACDGVGVAKALLGDRHFDILTVSYRFPGSNGLEIIKQIRTLAHRKGTPVMMVTGGPEVTAEALAAGANTVLYKPIEPSYLVAAVIKLPSSLVAA